MSSGGDVEVPLAGGMGSGGAVVRVGATVRRPIRPESDTVALFLRHLEVVGFEGAPRHLGTDDRGRAVLTYVEGDVGVPPFPAWVADGVLLGPSHDCSARSTRRLARSGSPPTPPGIGPTSRARARGHRLPQRPVRRERRRAQRRVVAFIDFDFAAPNRPAARHRDRGEALGADARSRRPGSRAASASTRGPASVRSATSTALTRRSVSSLSTTSARSSTERWCRCGPVPRAGQPLYVAAWEARLPAPEPPLARVARETAADAAGQLTGSWLSTQSASTGPLSTLVISA